MSPPGGTVPGGTVHGTAFLLGETGLLVLGRSGAGKSMLVAGLAAAGLSVPVRLVADDRVQLTAEGHRLVARPIAGFLGRIEIRGTGMASMPAMPSAIVRGVVRLAGDEPARLPDQPFENEALMGVSLPVLRLREGADCTVRFLPKWTLFRDHIWKE